MRGLAGSKHVSEVYDDDDLLRLQQDDATVSALLLDDVVLGGRYGGRNTVSVIGHHSGQPVSLIIFLL